MRLATLGIVGVLGLLALVFVLFGRFGCASFPTLPVATPPAAVAPVAPRITVPAPSTPAAPKAVEEDIHVAIGSTAVIETVTKEMAKLKADAGYVGYSSRLVGSRAAIDRRETATNLQAEIEGLENQLESTERDLDNCRHALRTRGMSRQLEKDLHTDETRIAKLNRQLQEKQSELKSSGR